MKAGNAIGKTGPNGVFQRHQAEPSQPLLIAVPIPLILPCPFRNAKHPQPAGSQGIVLRKNCGAVLGTQRLGVF